MIILLYVLIVIFILGIVLFAGIGIFTENPIFMFGTYVFIALAIVCICMLPNKNPSELYQEKVKAVEKANKELEKFLIDYPEFREE